LLNKINTRTRLFNEIRIKKLLTLFKYTPTGKPVDSGCNAPTGKPVGSGCNAPTGKPVGSW